MMAMISPLSDAEMPLAIGAVVASGVLPGPLVKLDKIGAGNAFFFQYATDKVK
jgi:hypothetical protein